MEADRKTEKKGTRKKDRIERTRKKDRKKRNQINGDT
jgi:hypothetical protein